MSEKRVNIKITASTSDFDKAIKKAQKQIEELAKAIEDIGDGKFGNKLEKQLESVSEAARDMHKQLEEMQDTLDDINKSKVDKLENQLEDITDSTEDLNDALEDTTDTLDDVNKANMDKLEKQLENVIDSSKELNNKMEDVIDTLSEMDDIDVDNVRRSFENLEDSIKDIDSYIDEATDSMQDFNREMNDVDFTEVSNLGDLFSDVDTKVDNITDSMQGFNREMSDLDTSQFEDFSKSMEEMGDSFKKKFNIDANFDSNGNNNSIFDNVAEGLISGTVAGRQLSSAMQETLGHLSDVINSMKDMSTLSVQEQVKSYDDLINTMIKVQDEMNNYKNRMDELSNKQQEYTDSIKESNEAQEEIKTCQDDLSKEQKRLEEIWSEQKKNIEDYESALSEAREEVERYTKSLEDLERKSSGIDNSFDPYSLEQTENIIQELNNDLEELDDNLARVSTRNLSDMKDMIRDLGIEGADAVSELERIFRGEGFTNTKKWINDIALQMKNLRDILKGQDLESDVNDAFKEKHNELLSAVREFAHVYKDQQTIINLLEEQRKALDDLADAQERLNILESDPDVTKAYEDSLNLLERVEKEIRDICDLRSDLMNDQNFARMENTSDKNELERLEKESAEIQEEMDELKKAMSEGEQVANEQVDALNEQLKAYEKLSKRVKDYLSDESKSILLREKVAKSFKSVSDAMEQVYAGSSVHNNAELINKTLEEAAKYVKELNIVSTKNLQNDLERLGEILEDKTEKIKRFKDLANEYGSKDSGLAYWLEEEAKSLKDYAGTVPIVVEAMDTLRKAWGDVSVGGEDHLKIRARQELLENFEKDLKKRISRIKNMYSEFDSLDDIYEKATQEEKLAIEDWKAWEKNKESLEQYNRAITEYLSTIKDMGGQVDDKFLDNLGRFDFDKFIEDFDKMGASTVVLSKRLNAVKAALLEGIKAEKEETRTSLENAKANLQQAEAQLKAAKIAVKTADSDEDKAKAAQNLADAKERLLKAEREVSEAQSKADKYDRERIENAKKLVQQYNEQAEAARKLGIAIEDITKADIASFDKSLSVLMDDIFPSDLPKTLGDFKEDLIAVFESFDSFNLGDLGDGLKDVLGGALDLIPAKAKLAAAAIGAVVIAMNELYESGKRQFFEGLDKGFDFLSKLGDIARDVGQEVKDAFEDITGTNLDWSSLMALGVEFEHQMTKVGSLAGANTKQIEELTAKAKELGGATQFSASQVGEAFEYMATAGWDTEEMLEGVGGVINLSIGACSDLATTASVVTDGMTALGMSASDTAEYVNKLAAVANASNTSVELFGGTLKQVGSLAGSLGVTMTDLSTATGLMANSGVKGTRAGTALKNVLANMASPTERQENALKELGFTADETGSYLKTTAEGAVDLEATIKALMRATENLDTTERAALLTAIAGKEALPGLMAIIAQGEEAWDDLSKTIDNSSSSIQFWNQNMSIVGKSGEEATKHIDNLKQVFEETIEVARALDMSQAELSHIIALLGHDSNVTADNVRDLLAVEEKMSQITDEQVESLRQLDQAQTQAVNSGYDYDKTVAAIKADTQGMTQEQKKALIERLKEVETYKEAQQVISDYQDEINKANNTSINLTNTLKRQTFAEMSLIDTLEYLRATMGETIDDTERTILTNMGLGDSIDEISEILAMSQDEWEQYKTNLEETDGLTDELTDTMETTFRSALMEIASKIEDVVLALYDRLLPGLTDAAEAVKDFFATWRGGEEGDANYTWDNFETAIDDLATKIKESKPKIQEAVESLFDNVDTFISGGTLDSILSIGSSIINGICDGILKAEEDGTLDKIINDLIQKISNWIIDNGPKVQKVGTAILEALKDGIENNEALIENAMNVICDIIVEWTDKSGSLESAAGKFGEQFIGLAFDNMINKAKNWIKEKAGMLWDILSEPFSEFDFMDLFVWDFSSVPGPAGTAGKIGQQIGESIFGKDPAGDVMAWLKEKFSGFHPIQAIKNWFTGETYADSSEGGTLISGDGSSNKKTKSNKKSDTVDVSTLVNIDTKELALVEEALKKLQKVAQEAANTVRTEFVNMTNIVRNQMLNVSNIIRNQAVNWANIIRNQAKNARDAFTQQMISMASVARTQMVNVSNIIRNQSVNWANIVKNQAKNARDHFTQQMMSMVKVAKNQMYNVLTTIRSYMSQISSATNKTMNMKVNVNRTVATSYTGGTSTASALYAANTASTYSLLANNASALSARASSAISSGTNNLGSSSSGLENGQAIHMHVNLEGKEIARAAAKYMNGELKMINKREDRKRGVK